MFINVSFCDPDFGSLVQVTAVYVVSVLDTEYRAESVDGEFLRSKGLVVGLVGNADIDLIVTVEGFSHGEVVEYDLADAAVSVHDLTGNECTVSDLVAYGLIVFVNGLGKLLIVSADSQILYLDIILNDLYDRSNIAVISGFYAVNADNRLSLIDSELSGYRFKAVSG